MNALLMVEDISADLERDVTPLLPLLIPPEGRARILRYRQAADRNRALAAEALLRRALAERLGVDPLSVPLRRAPSGRPYVDAPGAPFVSLSHSGGYVAAALGDRPVGVDVETQPIPARVIRRFFPAAEWDAPDALALWTRREALAKAAGLPLAEALAAEIDPRRWQWETRILPGGARVSLVEERAGNLPESGGSPPTAERFSDGGDRDGHGDPSACGFSGDSGLQCQALCPNMFGFRDRADLSAAGDHSDR